MSKTVSILVVLDSPRPKYLLKLIQSLSSQTLPATEVVFFAASKLEAGIYPEVHAAGRVVQLSRKLSLIQAMNQQLPLLQGDVVLQVGQEDVLVPTALAVFSAAFDNPATKVAYANEGRISDWDAPLAGKTTRKMLPNALLLRHQNQMGRAAACLRSALLSFPLETESDYWHGVHLQLMEEFGIEAFALIPQVLYQVREAFLQPQPDRRDRHYMSRFDGLAIQRHLESVPQEGLVTNGVGASHISYTRRERPPVEVIVYGGTDPELIKACLSSISRLDRYPNLTVTVLVTPGLVLEKDNRVGIRYMPVASVHAGLNYITEHSDSTYLCLLYGHCEVISNQWLEEMLALAMEPLTGLVGTRVVSLENRLLCGGVGVLDDELVVPYQGWPWDVRGNLNTQVTPHYVTAVNSQCFMADRRLLLLLGGFAPEMTHSLALELCFKAESTGLHNAYCPEVTVQLPTWDFPAELTIGETAYFWNKYAGRTDKYYSADFLLNLPTLS